MAPTHESSHSSPGGAAGGDADGERQRAGQDPQPRAQSAHDHVVGGLGEEGTRIELDDAFGKFGPIKNIWLAKAPPSFAYIEMQAS